MTLEQLDRLLAEVCARHPVDAFVVIGSLCVLAQAQERAIPEKMLISVEVDAWPEGDPARAFEIARDFGLGSAFEQEHGYYFDAVSPSLPTLPDGWRERLTARRLPRGALVKFVDPNDVAMAKLARGDDKDLKWVRAGLDASLLSIATLVYRFRETVFHDDDERERVRALLREEAERAGISM
ncbi:MAG: DUF6036 family nucleotidyltransferase [Pseudomonadota bacterium]